MKNLFKTLLPLFILCSCSNSQICSIKYDASIKDYTPVVRELLEAHKDGNICLRFEKATYPFYPEEATEKYLCVSNNDNGMKKIAFHINAMKHVQIEGDSTLFLFHGGMVPFFIENAEDVKLEGFAITYDHPFVLEAEVVANSSAEQTVDIRIHPDNPYCIKDKRLYFQGYDWELPLGEYIFFNPQTRSPYYSTEKYQSVRIYDCQAEDLGDHLVRLSNYIAEDLPPVGSIFIDKGPQNRLYPAFSIQSCKDVKLEEVTVHESGAMALIAENTEDITLRNYSTQIREGSGRMISASADATHFINCKGKVILEDCLFESMLDDATNVHGTFMKVDSLLSADSFAASFGHHQQHGFRFAEKGDQVRFVDRKTLVPVLTATLEEINMENENHYLMKMDTILSSLEGRLLAVENLSNSVSETIIRNCTVRYNRARSMLISAPGKVLIENCRFASMMAGIRICGDANYWYESGQTSDITIRDNEFRDLSNGGWAPQAVLQIDPVIPHEARDNEHYYHRSIRFEDNIVHSFEDQLIYALSVEDLTIKGNTFIDSQTYPVRFPGLATIDVQYCGKVTVKDNDFKSWKKDATMSAISCDSLDTDGQLPIVENPNKYFFQN